ncbi:MAG: S8 family serine peptidase [Acidimicrobiia bacterium]
MLRSANSIARKSLASAGFLVCLLMACGNVVSAFAVDNNPNDKVMVALDLKSSLQNEKGNVVVTVASVGDKQKTIEEIKSKLDVQIVNDLSELPIFVVEGVGLQDIDTLISIETIKGLEPQRTFKNDSVDYLENVSALGLTTSSNTGTSLTGKGSVVGIIDSGINSDNTIFKDKNGQSRVVSQGCVNQDDIEIAPCSTTPGKAAYISCSSDVGSCWHGHAVAGFSSGTQMALTNDTGTVKLDVGGSAPESKISFFRIADSEAHGPTNISLLAGLNKFLSDVKNNPQVAPNVINISIGWGSGVIPRCDYFTSINLAIDELVQRGVTIVAASGNEGDKSRIVMPACLPNVIGVGASEFVKDANGKIISEQVAKYSNMSDEVDIVAPGTDLPAATPTEGTYYPKVSGTSFASPIVAGAVALLHQAKPTASPSEIKNAIVSGSDQIKDPQTGKSFPRLNVKKALSALTAVPATTTTSTSVTTTTTAGSSTTTPATTTTTVPVTTRPVPGSDNSAILSINSSENNIFAGEKVKIKVSLTNTGKNDLNDITTSLSIRGNVLKTTKANLIKDAKDQIVLEQDLSGLELAFGGKKPSADITPQMVNDIKAVSCWSTNVCIEGKVTVSILNIPPSYEREQHSTGSSQTYKDTITNNDDKTITNLVVKDAGLGVLKFDKTELKPGESSTTDIIDVGANYAPGSWEITITGTIDGREGVIAIYTLTVDDNSTTVTTTTVTPSTTTPSVSVQGQNVTRSSANTAQGSLPFTGGSSLKIFFAGLWLLLAGVMVMCFMDGFAKLKLARIPNSRV